MFSRGFSNTLKISSERSLEGLDRINGYWKLLSTSTMQQTPHMSHHVAATWSGTWVVFHQPIWIDAISKTYLIHSLRYLNYYYWFLYYEQISKIDRAIFLNFGFVFVLWPPKFGRDGVFTRIFAGFKTVLRGRRSDWIVTLDNRRYFLQQPCNRSPPRPPPIWMPIGSEFSIV